MVALNLRSSSIHVGNRCAHKSNGDDACQDYDHQWVLALQPLVYEIWGFDAQNSGG